jgi:patatin-like phospholipase/acyl hydrolase
VDANDRYWFQIVTSPARFQILSLDGGGVKALFSADVLARIEADLGVSVRDTFDLITGTSAGGIIALALGAGMSPAEIVDEYRSIVERVFPEGRRRMYRYPLRLFRTTYRPEPLRAALEELFGSRLLGDSDKMLVIPSWDAQNGSVHVFKTRHHPRLNRDWKIPMTDVALATSAAPTFLPAAQVDGHRLIDGGVWANNPSVVAIAEAASMLDVDLSFIRLLNIGTTSPLADHPRRLDGAGVGPWARRAPELLMAASSRGTQGVAEHLLSSERYHRFDAMVPRGRFTLDGADPNDLAGLSAKVSRDLSPVFATSFGGYEAGPFDPSPSHFRVQEIT